MKLDHGAINDDQCRGSLREPNLPLGVDCFRFDGIASEHSTKMFLEFTISTIIPTSPQTIYDSWLDSKGHSEMTGSPAQASRVVGGSFTAWDNYIHGRNLELEEAIRIVQAWRTTNFDTEHSDSIISVTLEPTDDETILTLVHRDIPEGQPDYQTGWSTHYFKPMQQYFGKS